MARTKTLGELLVQSLGDAVAFEEGRLDAPARTVEHTARDAKVDAPPRYDCVRVRATRLRLGYSQTIFARALNVSIPTVRAWEQGVRVPEGSALRLLEVAEEHPEILTSKVHLSEATAGD